MSEKSCSACNDIQAYAPEFAVNGVTDAVCSSLANNLGLNRNASPAHEDCEDLHDVNDCLIANMDDELEGFDVCEWKDFMHQYIPNNYETLKAMICSLCGVWCSLTKLVDELKNAANFEPTQTYLRSSDAGSSAYWHDCQHEGTITFNNADATLNQGTFYAPGDGVAVVTFCFAWRKNNNNDEIGYHVTPYDSGETESNTTRVKRAVHIGTIATQGTSECATAVKMQSGHYLKLRLDKVYDDQPDTAEYRLHQVNIVFVPTFELKIDPIGNC